MRLSWTLVLNCGLISFAALPAQAADNTPPPGFVALFNGKDLTGWKGLVADPPTRAKMSPEQLAKAQEAADKLMREHWKVGRRRAGLRRQGQQPLHGQGLRRLRNVRRLEDRQGRRQRHLPSRLAAGANLGQQDRLRRALQQPEEKNPHDPLKFADKPIGQWNTFRIKMVGEKVWVWFNGELVVDNVTLENYWERNKPIYPTGQIELQHHGSYLWFKNIYLAGNPPQQIKTRNVSEENHYAFRSGYPPS